MLLNHAGEDFLRPKVQIVLLIVVVGGGLAAARFSRLLFRFLAYSVPLRWC